MPFILQGIGKLRPRWQERVGKSEQQSSEAGGPFRPVPLLPLIHWYPEKKTSNWTEIFKNLRAFAWNIFSETKEKPRFASKCQITVNPLVDDSPNPGFNRKTVMSIRIDWSATLIPQFFSVIWDAGRRIKNNRAHFYYHILHNTICIWKYSLTVHSFLLHKPI